MQTLRDENRQPLTAIALLLNPYQKEAKCPLCIGNGPCLRDIICLVYGLVFVIGETVTIQNQRVKMSLITL